MSDEGRWLWCMWDYDVCEIIEEVYRRDKFDKEFNIGLISECEDDESISEDEE